MHVLGSWLVASIVMLALDGAWIALVMKQVYTRTVQQVQGHAMRVRAGPAVLAYIMLSAALLLVVWHTYNMSLWQSVLVAAAWGGVLYGTYAFTAASVFAQFPLTVAALDCVWGAVLFGLSVLIARVL